MDAATFALLKMVHIFSAMLLFGTGLGTFFFMVMALRRPERRALQQTLRTVVLADFVFTSPAVVVQMVTGHLLMQALQVSPMSLWFWLVAGLFVLVGLLWLPVVWIQCHLRDLVLGLPDGAALPEEFWRWARRWERMGYPAGVAMMVLLWLMVAKPWLTVMVG
jgi:uncharacterized membrane protein